jgi:hypothetical protein
MKRARIILTALVILLVLVLVPGCKPAEETASTTPTMWAQATAVQASDSSLAITIYNEGSALVRDQRRFDLSSGVNDVEFSDVASQIDPTSVLFKSLTDPAGTRVLEQNYVYDLVNTSALLEKYIDQPIRVITTDGLAYEGRLLSGRDNIILEDASGEVQVITSSATQQFSFPELPEGLITRPTLEWKLLADQAGMHDVEITYLTQGMTWQADYVLLLSETGRSLDLDGWVTLDNRSGATYQDALLKLIAGDLQRVQEAAFAAPTAAFELEEAYADADVEEREFFEYHLYEVPRPVTIRNNESKQIEFVSAAGVDSEKFYVYDGLQCRNNYWYCTFYGSFQNDPTYGTQSNSKVMVMVEFDSENVDADLPRGRVRLYQEDIDGAALLIGEQQIDHTPQGEILQLYVGDAFDIVGERVQTDFRNPSNNTIEEDFEITIRNHKDEAVEVRVVEHLLRWSEWRILRSNNDYTKNDSSTIEFLVNVPADGEVTLTYSVRYEWR